MNVNRTSIATSAILLIALSGQAQYAADAFRFSQINQNGTARFQGVGGNHTALGGDASSISGNPAGLGFYNRSEFSISPAFRNLNTQSTYTGAPITETKTSPSLAQASLIIAGRPSRYDSKWKRTSLGISFTRQQTFQNLFSYRGQNNPSGYVDVAVEDANRRGASFETLKGEYDGNSEQATTLAGAYFNLYAINPTTQIGPPYVSLDQQSLSDQRGTYESTGAHTQWTLAYAGNYDDKLYIGGSIGFNRIRYKYTSTLEDKFVTGQNFLGSTHTEDLNVSGNGVNVTLGAIYKATPEIQLGVSVSSPTFMGMKETFNQLVTADIVGIPEKKLSEIGLQPNDFEYTIQSPLRASGGVTYLFGQKGFLSGSVEYVSYGGMRVSTRTLAATDNADFRANNRKDIESTYKNAINARVGGEYRAGAFRARAGFAYLSDPYKTKLDGIDRNNLLYSGGIGFRNDRFFADIAGVFSAYKSAYAPYYLDNPKAYNTVQTSNRTINVILSVGTFF